MATYRCPKCGSSQVRMKKDQNRKSLKTVMRVDDIKGIRCVNCGHIQKQKPKEAPLKPWKDPESLFCDTEFLKQLFNKDPTPGKECKDV